MPNGASFTYTTHGFYARALRAGGRVVATAARRWPHTGSCTHGVSAEMGDAGGVGGDVGWGVVRGYAWAARGRWSKKLTAASGGVSQGW